MSKILWTLLVEDSVDDALLVLHELRQGGYEPIHERVDTEQAFQAALDGGTWDIVLSDFSMPHFDGLAAFELLKKTGLDIPFIFVSGRLGEDVAVEAMRHGAADYVLKHNLARLTPAIQRELREAGVRRERKRAEEQLAASQRLLQTVFDTIPVTLAVKDRSSRYQMVNRAWCERYGAAPADVIGVNSLDVPGRPEHEKRNTLAEDQKVLAGNGGPVVYEGWDTTGAGELRHYQSIKAAIRDENGEAVGLISATVDLTEQKRAEEKLRKSEAQLQTIVENLTEGVAVSDMHGQLLHFNRAALDLHGFATLDECHRHLTEFAGLFELSSLDGNILPVDQWPLARVLRGETVRGVEVNVRQVRAGWQRILRYGGNLVHGADGQPFLAILAISDVTERMRTEAELRASEERLHSLIEGAKDYAIYMLDPGGNIVTWNSGAERIMGYGAEEVIGQNFSRFYLPEDVANGRPQADLRATAELGKLEDEGWRIRKDGSKFWANGTLSLLTNGKQVRGFAKVVRDLTGRRQSEVLLRSVLENTQDAIIGIDERGIVQSINRAGERLFGYPASEVTGQNIKMLMPEPDRGRHDGHIANYLRTGRSRIFGAVREVQGCRKDGSLFALELSVTEFQVDGNRHFAGILRDITERNHAETKLRNSQRLLQTVFDTIPHHLLVKDREGRYLMVNKAWCETFGRTPEEVLHRPTSEQSSRPPEEVARILEEDRRVLSGESILTPMQSTLTVKTGEKRYFKGIKAPWWDESGATAGLVAISMDVTAEVEARQKADTAHAHLIDAIESLPAVFYMYDPEEKLLLWNSRCGEFYPETFAQLRQGMAFEEVVRSAAAASIADAEGRVEDWVSKRLDEFRNRPGIFEQKLKDGRWIQGIDRRTSDGGTVCLRFDVTELRQREAELRQSQKLEAIGSLAGGIAHDFNNLLTVIGSYSGFIQDAAEGQDAIREDAQVIRETSDRAAALTRQLLAFSRRQVLQMRVLDLNRTIESVEKMLRRLIGENIELRTSLQSQLCWIEADETQIEQIILNLAVNARDAMPNGGKLLIETSNRSLDASYSENHAEVTPGDYVMLAVTDTGHGMSPDVQKHIFEPFFTTKALGHGTGMGLATVYGIVKQMKGFIYVYSEPGRGTSFKIYFPKSPDQAESAAGPAETAAAPAATETVLLVEDEELVRRSAGRILEGAGYRVLQASDPEAALKICANLAEQIDLLLSDVVMPGSSGRELWDKVREARPMQVLFMSGYTDDAVVRHGILEGSVPFLNKPFTKRSLLDKVREVLGQSG